jgi:hypothetical protein
MAKNDQLTAAQAAADEAERYADAMEQEALAAEQRRDKIIASSPELSAGPREHARACRALATQAREEATELRAVVADGQEQE